MLRLLLLLLVELGHLSLGLDDLLLVVLVVSNHLVGLFSLAFSLVVLLLLLGDLGHLVRVRGWLVDVDVWSWKGLLHLLEEFFLVGDLVGRFLGEFHVELVVDERDHHTVVEGDHVGWLVVRHLLHGLHEHEGTVGGELALSFFRDVPSLFGGESDSAMVGRDGLELDANVSLSGSSDREDFLLFVLVHVDFLQDVFLAFVRADPGWSGSEDWQVILIDVVLRRLWSHDHERVAWVNRWVDVVGNLVKVVVDNLSEIDEGSLLDLDFTLLVSLDSGSVNNSQISQEVLSVLLDDHELTLPELLVVWNLEVASFSLSDLEDGFVSLEVDVNISQFFSVDVNEGEVKRLLRHLLWSDVDCNFLHVGGGLQLSSAEFSQGHVSENGMVGEVWHLWVQVNLVISLG